MVLFGNLKSYTSERQSNQTKNLRRQAHCSNTLSQNSVELHISLVYTYCLITSRDSKLPEYPHFCLGWPQCNQVLVFPTQFLHDLLLGQSSLPKVEKVKLKKSCQISTS